MLPLYDNIRRRRIELGMSQQELAEKSGYTDRSSIAKIESGKVDLTQSKIIAIAKALNLAPGALMGWTLPENQSLWRYANIKNDKMVLEFTGLSNDIKQAILREQNAPLYFDISPDVIMISKDTEIEKTSADNNEGFNSNTIKIAGRDGSFTERNLTDEQLELLKKMIEQLPNADNL